MLWTGPSRKRSRLTIRESVRLYLADFSGSRRMPVSGTGPIRSSKAFPTPRTSRFRLLALYRSQMPRISHIWHTTTAWKGINLGISANGMEKWVSSPERS